MRKPRIRWGRVLIAALLSEAGVIAVLIAVLSVYRFLIAPGRTAAEYQAFADLAVHYAAPAAAGVATFLSVLWAARKLASDFIANGVMVGVAAVALTIGFLFAAKPDQRLMYVVSYALRLAAGLLGGLAAQSIFARRRNQPSLLAAGRQAI